MNDYELIPKEIDRIIVGAIQGLFKEQLPQDNISWLLKITRVNYRKEGLVYQKLERGLKLSKSDIYKVVIAYTRHRHTEYVSHAHSNVKKGYANHAIMRKIFDNNDDLIQEMLESLTYEQFTPKFKGKYYPNMPR